MKNKRYAKRNIQRKRTVLHLRLGIIFFQAVLLIAITVCIRNLFFLGKSLNYAKPVSTNETKIQIIDPSDKKSASNTSMENKGNPLLILVNADHLIPEDYSTEIIPIQNNQSVSSVCLDDLQNMIEDCQSAGHTPVICSSYRSTKKQRQLYREQIQKYINYGYSQSAAEKKAGSAVAVPGTSEHELGLAVDIVDIDNQRLEKAQENTPVQQWLIANSWKYGFILRYPSDKAEVTGIMYEPWHYRYVGKEAAKYIYEHKLCLEEYLDIL